MALHVTTEVGKPGRREREKRHFFERRGEYVEERRGRRFIQHGVGEQPNWVPHARQIDIKHSEKGQLDWVSKVRRVPGKPEAPENRQEFSLPRIKCFPEKFLQSTSEWTAYPEGFHNGRKCKFERVAPENPTPQHRASLTSTQEVTHFMLFGNKRKFSNIWERRGDIPFAALGDKSYQVPEYSPQFHKVGSTRPVVCFGGPIKTRPDTFVPLQPSMIHQRENYNSREMRRKFNEEVDQVKYLDKWTPAPVLVPPVVWEDGRKLVSTTGT